MAQTIKVTIWNSTSTDADNRARLEILADGKPHKIIDSVKTNMSKYAGKVVGNTILVNAETGTQVTMAHGNRKMSQPQAGKETRFGGDDEAPDDDENYDVSNWTLTAKK